MNVIYRDELYLFRNSSANVQQKITQTKIDSRVRSDGVGVEKNRFFFRTRWNTVIYTRIKSNGATLS